MYSIFVLFCAHRFPCMSLVCASWTSLSALALAASIVTALSSNGVARPTRRPGAEDTEAAGCCCCCCCCCCCVTLVISSLGGESPGMRALLAAAGGVAEVEFVLAEGERLWSPTLRAK